MLLFLDIHRDVEGLTVEAVESAHLRDLELQHKYDVTMLKYWYDVKNKVAFCLMLRPSKEACMALHREAHGLVTSEIYEVAEGREPALTQPLSDAKS